MVKTSYFTVGGGGGGGSSAIELRSRWKDFGLGRGIVAPLAGKLVGNAWAGDSGGGGGGGVGGIVPSFVLNRSPQSKPRFRI